MCLQFLSFVILLAVITFQSSQAARMAEPQNSTVLSNKNFGKTDSKFSMLENCKDELSKTTVKQQPMMGGSDYLCESKFIGKEDKNNEFPSSCEKGPGWRGVLDKTKNLENSINWWKLVQQPDCVDRITLRQSCKMSLIWQIYLSKIIGSQLSHFC